MAESVARDVNKLVELAFELPLDKLREFCIELNSRSVGGIETKGREGKLPDKAIEAMGVANYRLGDQNAARNWFARVSGQHIFHVRSLVVRMRLFFSAGDNDSALQMARAILDIERDNQEAMRTAGRVYNSLREFDHADAFWRQLVEVNPRDYEAALQVARIAARRRAWDSVELYAAMAQELNDGLEPLRLRMDAAVHAADATAVAREVLPLLARRDAELTHRFLGILLNRDSGLALAETVRQIRVNDPPNELFTDLAIATTERWIREGQSAEMKRNDERAGELYAGACVLTSDSKLAKEGLARISRELLLKMRDAQKKGLQEEAEQLAERLELLGNAEASFFLGRLYLVSNPHRAIPHFEHCVQIEPGNSWFRLNLARAFARAERLVEAHAAFGEVIESDALANYREEAISQRRAAERGLLRQGFDAFNSGDHNTAIALFDKCRSFPEYENRAEEMFIASRRALLTRARDLFNAKDPAALDAARTVLRYWPENIFGWQIFARTLTNARRHREALEAWEQLATLQPDEANYRLQIARCCSWLGENERGVNAARRALALDSSLSEAGVLERRMLDAMGG